MADGLLQGAREGFAPQFIQGIKAINQQEQALRQGEAQKEEADAKRLQTALGVFKASREAKVDPAVSGKLFSNVLNILKEDFPGIDVSPDDTAKQEQLSNVLTNVLDPKKPQFSKEIGAELINQVAGGAPEQPIRFQEEIERERQEKRQAELIEKAELTTKQAARFQLTGKIEEERAKGTKSKEEIESALKLQDRFVKNSGEFVKIRDSFGRISAAATDPSAAGDLALIFNYMKMLDPGSVVRESEFATAANAAGVDDRVRNIWNRLLRGERLASGQRDDFVDRADRLFDQTERQQAKTEGEFRRIATNFGLSPEDVIIDLSLARQGEQDTPEQPPATAPQQVGRFTVEIVQ
jgi:hypothetical protein